MLPTQLMELLRGIRRRARMLSVLQGAGRVLAVAAGLLLGVVLLDYLLNLPASVRVGVMLLAGVVVGWMLGRRVVRPVVKRISLDEVAGRLELAFPQFGDRLRSTVDFLSDPKGAHAAESEAMRQRVIQETTELARKVEWRRAVVSRGAWYSLGGGMAAVGALVGLGVLAHQLRPGLLEIAVARLTTPFAGRQWPRNVEIQMVGMMPDRAPAGQRLEVKMRLARGDRAGRTAIIHYRYGDGAERQEQMIRGADGIYSASLDARNAGAAMSLWIEAGDDRTRPQSIEVVPPLSIRRVEAMVTPPKYAGGETVTTDLSAAPAVAVAGSRVELKVQFNQPLAEGGVRLEAAEGRREEGAKAQNGGKSVPNVSIQWKQMDKNSVAGVLAADQSMRFRIRGTDRYGFHNSALEEYELAVRPDGLPGIQIELPRHSEERTAHALVPLQGAADDDFGIRDVTLMVDRVGKEKYHWEVPLVRGGQAVKGVVFNPLEASPDRRRYRINQQWLLSSTGGENTLKAGDVLEYYLQVRDNFLLPGKPVTEDQVASPDQPGMVAHRAVNSGKLRLTIVSDEEMVNRVLDEFRALAEQITGVRDSQQRTQLETANLARQMADKKELSKADQAALQRLMNQQTAAASAGRQLVDRVNDINQRMRENQLGDAARELEGMAGDVSALLKQATQNSMKAAAGRLGEAAQQSDAASRQAAMKGAQGSQQAAFDQLGKALDRLKEVGSLRQSMEAVARLLEKQRELSRQMGEVGRRNLGKTLEQMSDQDRALMEKLSRDQEALAGQSDQAMKKMQKTADQLEHSDSTSAGAMRKAAQTAQQQQVVPSQRQAAKSAEENRQSEAQAAQRQAELGLQMILGDLQEAQRHKMEELARHQADLKKQVEHLVRRQAGHNLDNLQLQGEAAVKKVGDKALADLRQEAGRPGNPAPKEPVERPTLDQLKASQALTERNTRDIAQSAGGSDGVATTGLLIQAAGEMERASAALGEQKLAQAYDPEQTGALASLQDALKQIERRQEELNQQLASKKRDSIRQAYEKIRDEQKELNGQVASIAPKGDKAPELNRADILRLRQLAGTQKKLAGRVGQLDNDLTALDSIVFLWANQDIARAMDRSTADLGKPEAGRQTQLRQQRIVALLDDMIKNLAVEPRTSEFEQRQADGGGGGGGGGGSQKPQLPPETELRLLKALQQQVNGQTQSADAAGGKDDAHLAEIGQRQKALRGLLDTLLQKASGGKVALGQEPPNRNVLPEEMGDAGGLEQELLGSKPEGAKGAGEGIHRLGERMGRSHQRLALNHDPGQVTQTVQKNILKDLDQLIDQSRQQMAKNSSNSQKNNAQAQQQQKPPDQQQGQPDNQQAGGQKGQAAQGGTTAAKASTLGPGSGESGAHPNQDIRQTMREWGGISPRTRAAVIDSAGETVIQKYQKLVEDYYRSLATKEGE